MLVANSFDQWQKDTFFSAAEEVQQSADIMESAYRTWQRMKIGSLAAEGLDELCRELQTALGTAKWQLDEFERAVRSSYRKISRDDTTVTRHREFINVIERQISRVETALRDFLIEDGKKPLCWIHLDEDDRDDLAAFLSGSLPSSQVIPKEESVVDSSDSFIDIEPEEEEQEQELEEEVLTGTSDDTQLRTWSSPTTTGSWKIGVADDERKESPLQSFKVMLIKDKESKPLFSNWLRFRGINRFNQILGWQWRHRQLQTPLSFQFTSARFKFALTLVAFLMVPFILYST